MKVNELRIGNYINYGCEICEVDLITLEYISILNNDYKPITLTEKWLIDFGFEKEIWRQFSYRFPHVNEDVNGWVLDNIYCFIPFNKELINPRFYGRRNTDENRIGWNFSDRGTPQYVHELQNLHFALTGTELTLK